MIPQTPWTSRTFSFDFPAGHFPIIFSRLEGSIFRLYSLLSNADEEICSRSTIGWSPKEHVGHLYDLEELWWKRIADFRLGRQVLTAADMSNTKTNEAGHNNKTLEKLLEQFSEERQKLLESIYAFDETILTQTALHPRLQMPMRVVDALFFIAEHDDHHIATLSGLLRKPQMDI
jgi:uncharacterized damage-inducible protein DinB